MKNFMQSTWVKGILLALALIGIPTSVFAAQFNNAPNDYPTVSVANATQNPFSDMYWSSSATAVGDDMVSVEIYYHNTAPDTAQNTVLRLNVPNTAQTNMTVTGSVSASNAATVTGSGTFRFTDGQPHTLRYAGTMRWYPDQPSADNRTPRPLLNGQSGTEVFGQGLYIGNVPPNSSNGQWTYSQGTLAIDFYVSPAQVQAVCPAQVTTNPATNITFTGASFSGNISPVPGGSYVSWFEYDTNASFSTRQSTFQQNGSGSSFFSSASNLQQGTTYYLRAMARSTDPNCPNTVIQGNTVTFRTLEEVRSTLTAVTNPATGVTQTSATLNGTVTGQNVTNVTRWFEWGQTQSLGTPTATQIGQGAFSEVLSGLTPGRTYYFRAYGRSNETGIVEGGLQSFQTPGIQAVCPANVITNQPTNITFTSANFSGTVSPVPSGSYIHWFDYGVLNSAGQSTAQQSGTGASFTAFVNGLQSGTTYFVRAMVRSTDPNCSNVNIVGNTVTFQTPGQAQLTATTQPATNITQTAATLNGTVSGTGVTNVTRWFEWGDTVNMGSQTGTQFGQGTFSEVITGLTPGRTYYFRAYGRSNETGVVPGNIQTFQTPGIQAVCPSQVTTLYPTNITQTAATFGGTITPVPAGSYLSWFEYGTSYSYGQSTSQQTSTGSGFSGFATNLLPGTTYYVRAVARSLDANCSQVTLYGNPISFTTQQTTVQAQLTTTTNPATNVGTSAATLNGFVTSSNATNITRWFEWGQTIALGSQTPVQYGSGTLQESIYGLQPNTTYYFRAMGRSNETGVVPGAILTFRTAEIAVQQVPLQVFTEPATFITTTSARLNGRAIMSNVQAYGWFEWGTTPSLGRQTSELNLGSGYSNSFFSTASGLTPNTLYYFRAVARNTQGQTVRGELRTFRTLAPTIVTTVTPPPQPPVTLVTYDYVRVTTGDVITKTIDNLTFPNGSKDVVCVHPGHIIQYTITAVNPSWSATQNIIVTDVLSPFTEYKSSSDGGTYNAGNREVRWNISLRPREAHTFTLQAVVKDIADNVIATNSATMIAGGRSYTSGVTRAIITVEPIILQVTSDKASVAAGDTITYRIQYTNQSGAALQNVQLRVMLPMGAVIVNADRPGLTPQGNMVMIPLGTIPPKQSGSVTMTVRIPENAAGDVSFGVIMGGMDGSGMQMPEMSSFMTTPVTGRSAPLNTANVAESKSSFLPTSLLGWLAFFLLLLVVLLVIMKIAADYRASKNKPPATV